VTRAPARQLTADVAVVGSGFAGALTALALRARGRSVALLERGRHPRFAIGESSTPLANLLLEQLCDRYGLDEVRPFVKWGRWRRERPEVACGLKRGFSFFFHRQGQTWADAATHARQLLVAASPHDDIADTHWYRPEFDAYLVGAAERAGVTYIDGLALSEVEETPEQVTLCGTKGERAVEVRAQFLVDATGPRGFLHRTLGLDEQSLRWLPPTHALFAHFEHVRTWADVARPGGGEMPPYPIDAAALHHVFPGGWIWVLRFDNGITSAGAAVADALAEELQLRDGASAWQRLLARLPSVQAQFLDARPVTPFTWMPRLAFRSRQVVGRRWAMLPSAAGVIDPLLSTGFPLTLLGVHRLVEALDAHWEAPALADALAQYAQATTRELDATERLVGALYSSMDDPVLFKRLALLYFAAASYSETVRRLGRPERARGFLLCDDPQFGAATRACTDAAQRQPVGEARDALLARIDAAVEPFDVAGLSERSRRDWYPVLADDLRQARDKVAATREDVEALIARCGLGEHAPPGRRLPGVGALQVLLVLVLLTLSAACQRQPVIADEAYREAVVAFHTGVAAMQTSQEVLAREQLDRVTTLAEHEPAGWANLGLLLLRQQELEPALQRLRRAEVLAPDHAGIQRLLALAAGRNGDLTGAIGHWEKAIAAEPDDPKAAYALALDLERAGGDENEAEALRVIEALATRSGNLAAQVEFARLAAKRDDASALQRAVTALEVPAAAWPEDIRTRFAAVKDAAAESASSAGRPVAFLKNFLLRLPTYRQAISQVSTPREEVGEPLYAFVVLPNPRPQAAPADTSLSFTLTPVPGVDAGVRWTDAVSLTGEGAPAVAAFDGTLLQIIGASATRLAASVGGASAGSAAQVLAADLNYDFRTDLVVTGPEGARLLRQGEDGRFSDVTASATVPAAVLSQATTGAWTADIDLDGDLDVVLGAADGAPHVLRNNGDGTFAAMQPFAGVTRVRGFIWADLDGEGVPDAVFLQADGRVRTLLNMRGGAFDERRVPDDVPAAVAIAAADAGADSMIDVLVLGADGAIVRLSQADDEATWTHVEVARVTVRGVSGSPLAPGDARVLTGDVDNNGALDVIVSAPGWTQVLLADGDGSLRPLDPTLALHTFAIADLDEDGRLDLLGLDTAGTVQRASSRGTTAYHWQVLRPRAATAFGDQRINAFGIGGEVEVRTGLHVQKRLITSPIVHVGLGDAARAEVVRLLWPNGTIQSEFGLDGDRSIAASQRLKGSCPWLFAWNGREMAFVTDVLWRSPLGLRINAQATADVLMTEDVVKVRGDQLVPRDGAYDLRITAELWETHFFDLVSLLVVDHPEGTDVWVDERFAVPPPSNDVVVTGPVQPLAGARDDEGRDVAAILAARDDQYLDFAGRGRYQGITREHFVEIEIPADVPRHVPVWIIAQGWIHPTDSSINVAISQGDHPAPKGIAVQVADASGRFRLVEPNIGFPAGKDKTILVDLSPHLASAGPTRVRLATNLEIFWDRIGWAEGRPDVFVTPRRLVPDSAELRYRGYSVTSQADASVPERPRYVLEGTTPRWRDLEGYHTRFGDVRDLILGVDDRYVIMNAGDELQVRFPEAPPVADGHVRDFVVVSDGWEKDGDYNTTYSRTVLPLPTHDTGRYDRAPGRLEDDPVYLKHPSDFAEYHTRYVTPDRARDALRPSSRTTLSTDQR
jgi:flavin-dependent dehydrogenase